MDPLLEIYEDVGRRRVPAPVDYNEYKRLLAKARKATDAPEVAERLLAVDVAGAIGRDRGMYVVRLFQEDPAVEVRQRCLDQAIQAGEPGLLILRHAAEDPDPEIAMTALSWLRRAVDPGCATSVRKLLKRPEPAIRAAAAELLGHVAGPGLVIALRPLTADPEPSVSAAADEAIARLEGRLQRATPEPWWTGETHVQVVEHDTLPLPEVWPEEPTELLRLLGAVGPDHIGAVIQRLEQHGPSPMGFVIRKCRPNDDRALNLGAARLALAWRRTDWVVPIRRLLPDDDPEVRIAVAECLAVIGGPSVIMGVRQLLQAPHPAVRAAAVRSLARLCDPRERERFLHELANEDDPIVLQALNAVRETTE